MEFAWYFHWRHCVISFYFFSTEFPDSVLHHPLVSELEGQGLSRLRELAPFVCPWILVNILIRAVVLNLSKRVERYVLTVIRPGYQFLSNKKYCSHPNAVILLITDLIVQLCRAIVTLPFSTFKIGKCTWVLIEALINDWRFFSFR